ncbi:hypothetical protein E2C00_17185 [Streptomyces sp. WAC05374]|uniref:hypothetical protein n=1 Tax=Streptomyces sp. WAC05374 TaxID=2487420 RepID=UPI000F86B64E|nr:hypothetical protein [Streptomyces sp. WAC05374]RST16521.1 hypothetical protein EF905_11950 [Streptomyces sp. WAC05374]TDF54652.1 hypothetical protein E2C00_17185 [Streptomyces sp. WAC05374]TDF56288.1 hypothetical protein E2C02_12640 [Streptomyces sp. WAC05374]
MDVITETVKIMTAMAVGAATAVGTEAARQVTGLVQGRLGGTEEGRAALSGLEQQPTAAESASALAEALRRQTDLDPHFAAQLEAALSGTAPANVSSHVTHSIQFSGSARVRRNTISLGPVTFNNTPAGRTSMVIVVAALVTLLALSIYGGVRILGLEHAPSQGSQPPGGGNGASQTSTPSGETATSDEAGGIDGPTREDISPLTDEAAVIGALPASDDLPVGWLQIEAPRALDTEPQDPGRLNASFVARAKYTDGDTALTRFIVFAYADEKAAEAGYALRRSHVSDNANAISMAKIGDQSFAYTSPNSGQLLSVMRSATVVVEVSGSGSDGEPYSGADLETMTRLMEGKVLSAQLGLAR